MFFDASPIAITFAVEPSYYGGSTTSATLTLKSVPAGVYVLRVTDTNGCQYQRKIVVK